MKITFLQLMVLILSFPVFAELPNPNTTKANQANPPAFYNNQGIYQGTSPYGQGYGNQFGYPQQYGAGANPYGQVDTRAANTAKVQRVYNTAMVAKDVLWVFTGNESTFGKRLFYVFSQALFNRVVNPIENSIGNLGSYGRIGATNTQTPYVNQGAQYCYDCMQNKNTNPYTQNQNAINPAIFNGAQGSSGGVQR